MEAIQKIFSFTGFLFLICRFNIFSQIPALDKFIQAQDSRAAMQDSLRLNCDTVINGLKLKIMSAFSPEKHAITNYYYGKIEIQDGKITDGQLPAYYTLDSCCTCYLYSFRYDGILYSEGVYCTDCIYGHATHYYRNGNISKTFNNKPDNRKKSRSCSLAHGEQALYNYDGIKLLSEYYEEGKLLRTVSYHTTDSGTVKFKVNEKTLFVNDTIQISDFLKVTLHSDTL